MPTEVDETIRAITAQTEHLQKNLKEFEKAYDEFSLKCQGVLDKEIFDYISDILYKGMKYFEFEINECNAAKKEIMDKYDIMYNKEE